MNTRRSSGLLAIGVPILFIVVILTADIIESPKTAYVGVLTMVPLFSAIFGNPWQTAFVAVASLASGWIFGLFASDGNVPAQTVRLIIIGIMGVIAVAAAALRQKRDRELVIALREAAQLDRVREQAHHDELTGLLNRRGAIEILTEPESAMLSLAILDCDHFKEANDRYGHATGDEFLAAIGGRLRSHVASTDIVARWGGDEFLIALQTDPETARNVVERLVADVSSRPIQTSTVSFPVTLSAGVSNLDTSDPGGLDAALRRADAAMYQAKEQGRSRVRASWEAAAAEGSGAPGTQ